MNFVNIHVQGPDSQNKVQDTSGSDQQIEDSHTMKGWQLILYTSTKYSLLTLTTVWPAFFFSLRIIVPVLGVGLKIRVMNHTPRAKEEDIYLLGLGLGCWILVEDRVEREL